MKKKYLRHFEEIGRGGKKKKTKMIKYKFYLQQEEVTRNIALPAVELYPHYLQHSRFWNIKKEKKKKKEKERKKEV